MASTPVKTSQVDRLGSNFVGASANTDATKLKGRASPESVRHFESLLDATNRAAPAEKPASKPAVRNSNRADTSAKTAEKNPPSSASAINTKDTAKPKGDAKANALDEVDTNQAANIADTDASTVAEDVPAPTAETVAASASPSDDTETTESLGDTPAAPGSDPSQVIAIPVPSLPLPVMLETEPAQQASQPPQAGAVQAVPVDVDLSQQEPIVLPPAVIEDALAAATAPASDNATPVASVTDVDVAPNVAAAQIPTAQASVTPAQQAATAPAAPTDAVIETLTVFVPETAPEIAAPETKTESAPAQQTAQIGADAQSQSVDAQVAAVVAPIVTEAQPKAKAHTNAVPQQDAEAIPGLPKPDAVPAPTAEAKQDQNRQDQSPAERGRDRAQERAKAGERLAARFADNQISLSRDEASLAGPIQTFKVEVKAASAEALLATAANSSPDAPKAPTTASAAAAVVNNTSGTSNTTPTAKAASRPNSPVFQTPIIQQVGTRLVETAANGGGRVIMDLRPEHLGRVTIDVDVRDDGRVTATVLVDNPEALEQLRRDAGQLEQALRDTGLNPEQNSLNFALREQAQENGGFGREGRRGRDANGDILADAEAEPEVAAPTKQSVVPGLGVIDIRI